MNIPDMISVLQAAERGEKIEVSSKYEINWTPISSPAFNFEACSYRIAPKPQMTLVELLREHSEKGSILDKAADRIEELEEKTKAVTVKIPLEHCTTDELLTEIARRLKCD